MFCFSITVPRLVSDLSRSVVVRKENQEKIINYDYDLATGVYEVIVNDEKIKIQGSPGEPDDENVLFVNLCGKYNAHIKMVTPIENIISHLYGENKCRVYDTPLTFDLLDTFVMSDCNGSLKHSKQTNSKTLCEFTSTRYFSKKLLKFIDPDSKIIKYVNCFTCRAQNGVLHLSCNKQRITKSMVCLQKIAEIENVYKIFFSVPFVNMVKSPIRLNDFDIYPRCHIHAIITRADM